jgi:hypothetical protein
MAAGSHRMAITAQAQATLSVSRLPPHLFEKIAGSFGSVSPNLSSSWHPLVSSRNSANEYNASVPQVRQNKNPCSSDKSIFHQERSAPLLLNYLQDHKHDEGDR